MSIYRGYRPLPTDVQVPHVGDKRPPKVPSQQSTSHYLRRAQPALVILPRTAIWLSLLPQPVQPKALAAQYARIANAICAVWGHPPACRKCLAELLTDQRGGRKGFPPAVLREIELLKRYYSQIGATGNASPHWDDSQRSLWDGPQRAGR